MEEEESCTVQDEDGDSRNEEDCPSRVPTTKNHLSSNDTTLNGSPDSDRLEERAALNGAVCPTTVEGHSNSQSRDRLLGRGTNFRARYWLHLFDNLYRAVDEIYSACEAEESVIECQV